MEIQTSLCSHLNVDSSYLQLASWAHQPPKKWVTEHEADHSHFLRHRMSMSPINLHGMVLRNREG